MLDVNGLKQVKICLKFISITFKIMFDVTLATWRELVWNNWCMYLRRQMNKVNNNGASSSELKHTAGLMQQFWLGNNADLATILTWQQFWLGKNISNKNLFCLESIGNYIDFEWLWKFLDCDFSQFLSEGKREKSKALYIHCRSMFSFGCRYTEHEEDTLTESI